MTYPDHKRAFLMASLAVLLITSWCAAEQGQPSENDQRNSTVRGKYGEKDIAPLPVDKREHSSQNVPIETEKAIRGDAARAGYNMRTVHQAWLRDASGTFAAIASTLPPAILDDPFNLEGSLQCFVGPDPRFVVLTSIGPDGERNISKESIPDVTSVRAMRGNLGMVTYDPTNGTISSGDIIRIFDLKNPSDRQEY